MQNNMKTQASYVWSKLMGLLLLAACSPKTEASHIFFLHNRFLETHALEEAHPEYGRVEYQAILHKFRQAGFEVWSEQRAGNVNASTYAQGVVQQIDSLLKEGVTPKRITVIGTSKGGYIAQYVSTQARNPDLNFVFIACYRDVDMEQISDINFCGNILTIYEKSDPSGVSALARKAASDCDIQQFKEIELNTGLRHGFVFKALDAWIEPCIAWAKRA